MGLKPNTTYYYRVKAINSTSESEYSDTMSVTTLTDNSGNVTPVGANTPIFYKTTATSNKLILWLNIPFSNEYIEEYKVTVSVNSDLSSPIYSNLTYVLNTNTIVSVENGVKYQLLTIGNLTADTTYYFSIRSVNSIGSSGALLFNTKTEKTIQPPDLVGITNLTSITARVVWNSVNTALSYQVDVSTSANFSTLVVNSVSASNSYFDIPVLIENTNYFYRVRSVNGANISKNSAVNSFKTLDATQTYPALTVSLSSPVIKAVRNINLTEFEIEWSAIFNAVGYSIDVSVSSTYTTFVVQNSLTTNTKFKMTGLTPGTIYYIRIKSYHPSLSSGYTERIITTLTSNINLSPPQLLTPSSILSTGFLLNWVKRNYATQYFLELSSSNTFSVILQNYYIGDLDSFTLDGLTPSTTYYLRLTGISNTESSTVSNILTVTTSAVLSSLTILAPSELTISTVRLNWVLNSNYVSYILSINKKLTKGGYLGDGYFYERNIGNVATYLLDIFLEANTTYEYILIGISANGDRSNFVVSEFTTLSESPFIGFSTDGEFLEWSGECNRLRIATDKYFKFLVAGYNPRTITSSARKFKLSNILNSSISYYIQGYFETGGLKSAYSSTLTTFNTAPLLLAPTITNNSANILWKACDTTNYRIQVKYNNSGTYTPITGHLYPITTGNTTEYFVSGLAANTEYSVQISYLLPSGKFSLLSLPLYFKTNLYTKIDDVALDGGLTVPTLTLNNIEFDRFDITVNGTYSRYLIEVSRQSNFLTLEKYLESTSTNFTYSFPSRSNTVHYVRVVGISGANRTGLAAGTVTTSILPSFSSALSTAPTLSSFSVLNETEGLINWSDNVNALGFTIELSTTNTFVILDKTIEVVYVDRTKALLTALSGTKVYYARVYAYNDNSISAYSNVITVDTTP